MTSPDISQFWETIFQLKLKVCNLLLTPGQVTDMFGHFDEKTALPNSLSFASDMTVDPPQTEMMIVFNTIRTFKSKMKYITLSARNSPQTSQKKSRYVMLCLEFWSKQPLEFGSLSPPLWALTKHTYRPGVA